MGSEVPEGRKAAHRVQGFRGDEASLDLCEQELAQRGVLGSLDVAVHPNAPHLALNQPVARDNREDGRSLRELREPSQLVVRGLGTACLHCIEDGNALGDFGRFFRPVFELDGAGLPTLDRSVQQSCELSSQQPHDRCEPERPREDATNSFQLTEAGGYAAGSRCAPASQVVPVATDRPTRPPRRRKPGVSRASMKWS